MKCPHCAAEGTHPVTETRQWEGDVWRRRRCSSCDSPFVTRETSAKRMPTEVGTNAARRYKNRRKLSESKSVEDYLKGFVYRGGD